MSSLESSTNTRDALSHLHSHVVAVLSALTQFQHRMGDLQLYAGSLLVLWCCVQTTFYLDAATTKRAMFVATLVVSIMLICVGKALAKTWSETTAITTERCVAMSRDVLHLMTTSLPSSSSSSCGNNNSISSDAICRRCRYVDCRCSQTPHASTHCIICERHLRDCTCDLYED